MSDSTPVNRTDNWTATVLDKLVQVGEVAREVGAAAVLDGGDFFDLKTPARNSHSVIQKVARVHREYPCPVYANVGNHDCVYGDYAFLPQQPLGVLYETGIFQRLYDEHELCLEAGGVKVRVVGVPYHGTRYDLKRLANIHRRDEDYLLVVAHLLASPEKCSMFDSEDVLTYGQLDAYPVDGWFFGHWHKDQGIARTPRGKLVVNIGSLTRGSLAQDDLERVPAVAVVRCTSRALTVEKRPLRHQPAEVAFDLARRDESLLREDLMEAHVEAVNESLRSQVPSGDLRDDIRSMEGVNPRVRETAILYLEKIK